MNSAFGHPSAAFIAMQSLATYLDRVRAAAAVFPEVIADVRRRRNRADYPSAHRGWIRAVAAALERH
jgi:hypothetical protein